MDGSVDSSADTSVGTAGSPDDEHRVFDRRRVFDRHRVRRKVGRGFWVLAVVVPLTLTASAGWSRGPQIEATLHDRAATALRGAGLTGVRVVMDGRQATAKVPTGRDPGKVERVL